MSNATDSFRREALAQFLRSRRERLTPAQVGIPSTGRRRTPGLRREEVAQLAGVGATWYTWLEQGRAIRVSASVLDSLARVLQLDADERMYLHGLARNEVPTSTPAQMEALPFGVQFILDALHILPAYLLDARWTIAAWNAAACRVFADFAMMLPYERNLLRFVFLHHSQRALLNDWHSDAQQAIAIFRANTGHAVGAAWHTALITELTEHSPEFAQWWSRSELQGQHNRAKALNHPHVGRLCVNPTMMQLIEVPQSYLVIYTPVDDATHEKLKQLMQDTALLMDTSEAN